MNATLNCVFVVYLVTEAALNLTVGFEASCKNALKVCVVKVLKLDPVSKMENVVGVVIATPVSGTLAVTSGVFAAVGVNVHSAALLHVAVAPACTTLIFTAVRADYGFNLAVI